MIDLDFERDDIDSVVLRFGFGNYLSYRPFSRSNNLQLGACGYVRSLNLFDLSNFLLRLSIRWPNLNVLVYTRITPAFPCFIENEEDDTVKLDLDSLTFSKDDNGTRLSYQIINYVRNKMLEKGIIG